MLNGRGVRRAVERTLGLRFEPLEPIPGPLGRPADLYIAKLAGGLTFIGWSPNLQSSFGVTRVRVGARVAQPVTTKAAKARDKERM